MAERGGTQTGGPVRLGHQEAWELVPWYVNGTLEGLELERFAAHLERCPLCQAEVDANRELAVAVREVAELPLSPVAGFERLMARIDAAGTESAEPAPPRSPAAARGWWRATPRAARWALALQAAALLALVIGLALARPPAPGPAARPGGPFVTLSTPAHPVALAPERAELRLVVAPTTPEARLRQLLAAVGGEIVAGPSPAGAYTVAVAAEDRDVALFRLRAAPEVALAEPVVVDLRGGARR